MQPQRLAVQALTLLALAAAGGILADTIFGEAGWPRRQALVGEVHTIMADNAQLTLQLESLRREVAAQAARPEVQEALVRDLLGYVRPHDVVVRLDR